jgi:serine protease Do
MNRTPELERELVAVGERLNRATVRIEVERSLVGSGVIWRPDGAIVTNAHVVDTKPVTVVLADGNRLPGIVLARDRQLDLAVLQVEATNLPVLQFGDSNALRVGELVLAVGNPLGRAGVLTTGIIHAVGPTALVEDGDWIQADVPLAPGNSGGPLATVGGQVMGINSAIAGGLALAVPSATVIRFLQQVSERPRLPKGGLGINLQPVAMLYNGIAAYGLRVLAVAAGSAADRAGVRRGDLLTAIDGQLLPSVEVWQHVLQQLAPLGRLHLAIVRHGRSCTCEVVW